MLVKKSTLSIIKTLFVLIVVSLIILFILEIKAYYFPTGMDNNSLFEALKKNPNYESTIKNNVNANNNLQKKEQYGNILTDNTDFADIFSYLESEDSGYEKKFKTEIITDDNTLGCYDNDLLLQNMLNNPSITCKTEKGNYFDIHKKNLIHPKSGNKYSFAEICPVTSGQERPIMCLYNQGTYINNINKKMSNLIDQVQINQGNRLDNVENSMTYHVADPNRLFNIPPVKLYNKHENLLEMGYDRRFSNEDQLDDLVLYGKRLASNLE
jgi:hypothetical protein